VTAAIGSWQGALNAEEQAPPPREVLAVLLNDIKEALSAPHTLRSSTEPNQFYENYPGARRVPELYRILESLETGLSLDKKDVREATALLHVVINLARQESEHYFETERLWGPIWFQLEIELKKLDQRVREVHSILDRWAQKPSGFYGPQHSIHLRHILGLFVKSLSQVHRGLEHLEKGNIRYLDDRSALLPPQEWLGEMHYRIGQVKRDKHLCKALLSLVDS
jgi:hypothetical protein